MGYRRVYRDRGTGSRALRDRLRDCRAGPTAANFGANLDLAEPIADYDGTPAGEARRVITSGSFPITGDAKHTVAAIIAAADEKRPPLRLALGSAAYEHIEHALAGRLEAVRKQKAIAHSADRHRSRACQNSAAASRAGW